MIFYGILPQLAGSEEGQEIWRKREQDDICQRFMAWFELSTSLLHGNHLRLRDTQYVPDSYHLTDGVNHPFWKIHILQLASLHNWGISNHDVHHVLSVELSQISQILVTTENIYLFFF